MHTVKGFGQSSSLANFLERNTMNFDRNISSNERTIRVAAGILLLAIAIAGLGLGSFFGFIFGIVGVVLVATSVISFCPIYQKLGKDTYN